MPKRKNKDADTVSSKYRRIRVISSDSSDAEEKSDPQTMSDESNDLQDLLPTTPSATLCKDDDPILTMPELPPDILSALGDSIEDAPDYGEEIHPNLAQRWLPILRKGLDNELKSKLMAEYKIPRNCTLLKSPTINPEISIAITESLKARDRILESAQQQLGLGITAINKALTLLITGDDKVQAIKVLSDSCRILSDLHFVRTDHRVKLLTPSLDKSFLDIIENEERDETLFGKGLSEKIKTAKAIEKQGLQIKKTTQPTTLRSTASTSRGRGQGNWSAPPHFPSNRRGCRGGYRANATPANQYTQRRAPPPPPLPFAAAASRYRTTPSSKYQQRAQRRH